MINFNIPVLDTTNFQQGMEDREEKNQSTRLRNREALMKMGDDAAKNGVPLTYEDLARMSQDHLGNASFLSVTSPSASMFDSLQSVQNKQAERVNEVRRREAFDNTEKEGKSVESYLSGRYANGDSDIQVLQGAQERYSPEVIDRIKPDFAKVKNSAELAATQEGITYGNVMFGDVDEFNVFKTANSSVPRFKLEGMQRAAEANERKRLAEIEAAATAIGATGPISAEAAEVELYAKVRNLAPKVSAEKLDKLVADGMKVILATSNRKQVADAQASRTAGLKALDANYANNQQKVFELETFEEDRKTKAAAAKSQEGYLKLKGQLDSIEAVAKDKKTKPEVKAELESAMASFAFMDGDASLFVQAVMDGDKAAATKIKTRAIPAEQYLENINITSRVINGVHRFDNLDQATSLLSRLGTSAAAYTKLGQEIASNDATEMQSLSQKVQSPFGSSTLPTWGDVLRTKESQDKWGTTGANEMTKTARMTSEMLLNGFKKNVSAFITDMSRAIGENGSVSATTEELRAMAYKVALERSKVLVSGMKLDSDVAAEMAEKVAMDIVAQTPELVPITKKVSRAEVFKSDLQRQRDLIGSPYGSETGVTQGYPVSGAASRSFR